MTETYSEKGIIEALRKLQNFEKNEKTRKGGVKRPLT
jgi:hypothetical protein